MDLFLQVSPPKLCISSPRYVTHSVFYIITPSVANLETPKMYLSSNRCNDYT